ncbi:MAG TPA: SufE family protein [Balneolales bacterium]|nr:SufE family protein [Balneolales bacterium]
MSNPPKRLERIASYFEQLDEQSRRERLIAFAEQSDKWLPRPDDKILYQDIRKDEECLDEVGVFIADDGEGLVWRMQYGKDVQILTRAIGTILSDGLNHAKPEEVISLPADVIHQIIGQQLFRNRSQSIYYIFNRIKQAMKRYLEETNSGR